MVVKWVPGLKLCRLSLTLIRQDLRFDVYHINVLEQHFVVSYFLLCFHHFLFLAVVKCEQWLSFVENFSHFEEMFFCKRIVCQKFPLFFFIAKNHCNCLKYEKVFFFNFSHFEYCQIWLNVLVDDHHLANITKLEKQYRMWPMVILRIILPTHIFKNKWKGRRFSSFLDTKFQKWKK